MLCDACSKLRGHFLRIDPNQYQIPGPLMQIKNDQPYFGHCPAWTEEAEMALLSDQPVMISGSAAFDPGARSATARREHEPSRQNVQIADKLRQVADILAAQKADPFRIAAYRRATESIRVLNDDLGAIAEKGGRDALEAVSFIGTSIASAIAEMVTPAGGPSSSTRREVRARKPCSSRSLALGRCSLTGSAKRLDSTQ